MFKWRLINYTDVWGNENDGYEVNNACVELDDLIITDDASDKDILDYLKQVGFLNTSDKRFVKLDCNGDLIEIESASGYPLGRLERAV